MSMVESRLLAFRLACRPRPMHFSRWGAKRPAATLRPQLGHVTCAQEGRRVEARVARDDCRAGCKGRGRSTAAHAKQPGRSRKPSPFHPPPGPPGPRRWVAPHFRTRPPCFPWPRALEGVWRARRRSPAPTPGGAARLPGRPAGGVAEEHVWRAQEGSGGFRGSRRLPCMAANVCLLGLRSGRRHTSRPLGQHERCQGRTMRRRTARSSPRPSAPLGAPRARRPR